MNGAQLFKRGFGDGAPRCLCGSSECRRIKLHYALRLGYMYMDSRGYASVLQVAMPLQVYALGYMCVDIKVVQVATPRLHVATPSWSRSHAMAPPILVRRLAGKALGKCMSTP